MILNTTGYGYRHDYRHDYRYYAREAVVITTASLRQKEEEQTGDTCPEDTSPSTPYENSAASATNPEQSVAYATTTSMMATPNTTRLIELGHKCGATIAHLPLTCPIRYPKYSIQKSAADFNGTRIPNKIGLVSYVTYSRYSDYSCSKNKPFWQPCLSG